jgi:hypothetical protein
MAAAVTLGVRHRHAMRRGHRDSFGHAAERSARQHEEHAFARIDLATDPIDARHERQALG